MLVVGVMVVALAATGAAVMEGRGWNMGKWHVFRKEHGSTAGA